MHCDVAGVVTCGGELHVYKRTRFFFVKDTECGVTVLGLSKQSFYAKVAEEESNVVVNAATGSLGGVEPMTHCVKLTFFDGSVTGLKYTKAS